MKKFRRIPKSIKRYVYDSSINIKDRSFVLFSILVLTALVAAIPCGLIMREPLSATLSTAIGIIFFTTFVLYSYRKNKIKSAKIIISVIVVFIFLPVIFFTNGGPNSGTPIWLLLGTIYIAMILDGRIKAVMIVANAIVTAVCWEVGYSHPEIVTEYSRGDTYFDSLAAIFIVGAITYTLFTFQNNLFRKEEEDKNLRRLFEQTATALMSAVDAKDAYTRGHSVRVAEYSKKIAAMSGMSAQECDDVYYAALLHDVGKIGIPEEIIRKGTDLTQEEHEIIMQHPKLGAQILHEISEYPNLMIGAQYHHERYDGKGYPEGLKGEDIPEIARIISVADSYDAMTSKRSYRDPIPQQTVREEIVKGAGAQFDPKYTKIMQHLIDLDSEYEMKEKDSLQELRGRNELFCAEKRDEISAGIRLTEKIRKVCLKCEAIDRAVGGFTPSLILFDSLDERYHEAPREVENLNYFEYAEIGFDGKFICKGARKIVVSQGRSLPTDKASGYKIASSEKAARDKKVAIYDIEAVKVKDHVQIRIDDMVRTYTYTIALPDSARFAYIGLTGENCHMYDVRISSAEEVVPEDYIPRIAEEISYINGPEGDIPNIQIDGFRSASTQGIPITDGMKITFHTMSLPTARLVWHCAFVDLFYSPDRMPYGDEYREYALIRLDGENWESQKVSRNKLIVSFEDDFDGWDEWKKANKRGYDCTVTFRRDGNKIITSTKNLGIVTKNTTTVLDPVEEVYVSLTGDQCALTNIRIETGSK